MRKISSSRGKGLVDGVSQGVCEVGECSDAVNVVSSGVTAMVSARDHKLMSEE